MLVGVGPDQADLSKLADKRGIDDRLRFVGRKPSEEIPLWMAAADALVLPSYSEGRPNVVLEAQACALPVVATRVGGTPELVKDGATGLLVESGDAAGLAAALARLRADGPLRTTLGQAGHLQASQMTWATSAEQMVAIYRDLAEAA